MELIEERNGFKICEREESELGYSPSIRYAVFHPEEVWFANFKSLKEAQEFCDKEDVDLWLLIER
ncbi:hypothetical protein B7C51_24860 (plasmid) [Paenibacillus larvae subsp. pulvifaciens]|uniref:Uncharacterized protein n=1 Tax=Paenibacillus larvae subsp. pulvifaciens TaxID=1477 RepID=A0A1V0V078_9BACL|nr:hypothetical protein B7C51_24860 [Paenibacillus larvae subsp. pulvifaciens]